MRLLWTATAALSMLLGCEGSALVDDAPANSASPASAPRKARAKSVLISRIPAAPPAAVARPVKGCPGQLDVKEAPAWSRRFPGEELEPGYSRRLDLLVDRAGDIYVVGDFKGALDLGGGRLASAGQSDLLVAKFDPLGCLRFARRFGDAAEQIYGGAALDPEGNLLLTGVFSGTLDFGGGPLTAGHQDIFLAKLDPDGKPVYSERFGGAGTAQWASAVAAGPSGEVVLAGNQEGTVDYGGLALTTHGLAVFVMKFDAEGRPIWGKALGGSVDQEAVAVGVAADGDVALGGNAKRVIVDGVSCPGKGMTDVFLARWSPSGELYWAGIFGDPEDQMLSGMALCQGGDMVVWGPFRGTMDFPGAPVSTGAKDSYEFFVARLDKGGQASFSRSLPTPGAVAVDPACNIVVGGSFEGELRFGAWRRQSAGGKDIFVSRLRADGEPLGTSSAGDEEDQRATAIAVDGRGRVVLLGTFAGALDLGSGAMQSESGKDLFLAKLPR